MGWYGGQEGAARSRWYDQSRAAHQRFKCSLHPSTTVTSFYNAVVDNTDRSSNLLVHNPASQATLIKSIHDAAPPAADGVDDSGGGGWSVSIAASQNLTDLSLLNDIAGQITGLFLHCCGKVQEVQMESFFSKLTNLESLTLICVGEPEKRGEEGAFLQKVFSRGWLPKLKFLETDRATDNVIAAMITSPDIREIVFDAPLSWRPITNEGFQRLVDAGGAKELIKVSAGTLTKHLSKTLTVKYMMATLPKLINAPQYKYAEFLTHMAQGAKKKSTREAMMAKYNEEDSKPFAVIPPERMGFHQLREALTRRNVKVANKPRPTTEQLRTMLIDAGWTVEQEQAFQNQAKLKALTERLERYQRGVAGAESNVASLTSGKASKSGKLYPLLGAFEINDAIRSHGNIREPKGASKRRDDRAKVLHDSGYQGGGELEQQIVHYRQVCKEKREILQEKEAEIAALRAEMQIGVVNSSSNAGNKRSYGLIS